MNRALRRIAVASAILASTTAAAAVGRTSSGFSLGLEAALPPPPWPAPSIDRLRAIPDPVPRPIDDRADLLALPVRLRDDLRAMILAPAGWNRREWTRFGVAAGAVALVSALDEPIHEAADRLSYAPADELSRTIRPLAQEAGLALLAGTWLAGRALDRPRWAAVGMDGIETSILASVLLTPALKSISGRTRPRDTDETGSFLAFGGGQSFPSGEATQAFALASVLAEHSTARWVKWGAYGLAGLLAANRIAADAHWTSDVVAGAAIGTAVGRFVVRRNRGDDDGPTEPEGRAWSLAPAVGPRGAGLGLSFRLSF